MRALAFGLFAAAASSLTAFAQDGVTQVVRHVTSERAERVHKALTHPGSTLYGFIERTGHTADNLNVGIAWRPEPLQQDQHGWSLRGRLHAAIVKNPDFPTGVALGVKYAFNSSKLDLAPYDATLKFLFDKVVHIRYRKAQKLLVVHLEAEEEHGSFNFDITEEVGSSSLGAGFGVSARSLSLNVKSEGQKVTVALAGLPYVVCPVLSLRIQKGGYLTLKLGLHWQSRARISADTRGVASQGGGSTELKFGWGQREVGLKARVSRSSFESAIALDSGGDGIQMTLRYDERQAHAAYDLFARADQRWHLFVDSAPILKVGSVHEERSHTVGRRRWSKVEWLPAWSPQPTQKRPSHTRSLARGQPPAGEFRSAELGLEAGMTEDSAPLESLEPGTGGEARVLPASGLGDEETRWGRIVSQYGGLLQGQKGLVDNPALR